MANASEQEIQTLQGDLQTTQMRASEDLKRNAANNRSQFIKISKEAEKLKGEMQTVRTLMSDLSITLGQPGIAEDPTPAFDELARKRSNRTSVANLEAMWNVQLQALWKNIEGSQKHIAAIPGRHIVLEAGHWVELDAATWKSKRPAHIVLLNDHLLIAVRKRKRVDPNTPNQNQKAPTKLVADRCFPLHDIDLVDLSANSQKQARDPADAKLLSNAVTVRHGHESFTYRTETTNYKQELLLNFKRAVDELRRAERSEATDSTSKSKESLNYLATRDPAISRDAGLMRSLSKSKDRPEVLIDVDGKQRNLRWVEGEIDSLDIEVALQQFPQAVDHVEQLRRLTRTLKSNTVAQDLINAKVDERSAKLASKLGRFTSRPIPSIPT